MIAIILLLTIIDQVVNIFYGVEEQLRKCLLTIESWTDSRKYLINIFLPTLLEDNFTRWEIRCIKWYHGSLAPKLFI